MVTFFLETAQIPIKDNFAFAHPAMFPESLAEDHIMTWTAPGDLVVDPFVGAGTTTKMAAINGRRWLGIDMSEEYVQIANKRMEVAHELITNGYARDYTPKEKVGELTHKEISSLSKKELVELVIELQQK